MAKQIPFNPNGEKLWVNVEMTGLYFITYIYQLWSAKQGEPPILTNPLKNGSNDIPHDDHYQVLNDFNPSEPVAAHDGRTIDVRFFIKKVEGDNGYRLKVTVLQGATPESAAPLGSDEVSGSVGPGASPKQEFIPLKLIAH